jgi:hypothetical protein
MTCEDQDKGEDDEFWGWGCGWWSWEELRKAEETGSTRRRERSVS